MAIQAQHPSNISLHNLRNSVIPDNHNFISGTPFLMTPDTLEELFQIQLGAANMLPVYSAGAVNQSMLSPSVGLNELENNIASRSRKRPRENEDTLARHHSIPPLFDLQQHQNFASSASALAVPQSVSMISTGVNPMMALTPSTNNDSSFASILIRDVLQSETMKQKDEINQLIDMQTEIIKRAMEEKGQRRLRCLLAGVEKGLLKSLKKKEIELEKLNQRNLELENCVKRLGLEAQIWQNVAKNNEVLVSKLRTTLEQAIEAEDAESCYYGETGDASARTFRENKELKELRTCKACRTAIICILLLPCRHLCLCKDCESRLDVCPVCGTSKTASLQVYIS